MVAASIAAEAFILLCLVGIVSFLCTIKKTNVFSLSVDGYPRKPLVHLLIPVRANQSGCASSFWLSFFFWAIDHLVLALLTLGNCKPYEMISSAPWVLEQDGKFFGFLRPIVDLILRPLGAHHCRSSYEWQIHIYEGKKP